MKRFLKKLWTRIIPEPTERSTYVLASSLALIALFWFWEPMGGTVWTITDPVGRGVMYALFASGWLLAFWATPAMTAAHLVFALATTAYILLAIRLEERDLEAVHGDDYANYKQRVPMLVPRLFGRRATALAGGR